MKRAISILAILLILAALSLTVFRILMPSTRENALDLSSKNHIIGGFSIDTPGRPNTPHSAVSGRDFMNMTVCHVNTLIPAARGML